MTDEDVPSKGPTRNTFRLKGKESGEAAREIERVCLVLCFPRSIVSFKFPAKLPATKVIFLPGHFFFFLAFMISLTSMLLWKLMFDTAYIMSLFSYEVV